MSDLAKRIMDAWLLTNPKPSENPERAEWWSNYHILQAMVKLGAYESAVTQYIMDNSYWVSIREFIPPHHSIDYWTVIGSDGNYHTGENLAECLFAYTEFEDANQ